MQGSSLKKNKIPLLAVCNSQFRLENQHQSCWTSYARKHNFGLYIFHITSFRHDSLASSTFRIVQIIFLSRGRKWIGAYKIVLCSRHFKAIARRQCEISVFYLRVCYVATKNVDSFCSHTVLKVKKATYLCRNIINTCIINESCSVCDVTGYTFSL